MARIVRPPAFPCLQYYETSMTRMTHNSLAAAIFSGRPVGIAASIMRAALVYGMNAIDLTAGNGNDTLLLARLCAPGHVFGIDIQPDAVVATEKLLEENHSKATVICADHARLFEIIPREFHGRIHGVMANLGYLPGGDSTVVTQPESTITALNLAAMLLAKNGLMTVVCYNGHAGGPEEAEAVADWSAHLPADSFTAQRISILNRPNLPPELVVVRRI